MNAKNLFVHPVGLALAITSGIVYIVCYVGVLIWPRQAMNVLRDWIHTVDFSQISTQPSFSAISFIRGLVEIMVFMYLAGIIFALIYDMCVSHCKRLGWIK
ncbi:MAG: hypothetical protein EPN86_00270 [Nanoarchaeota archaeon]|nr:MAG: hypothetical protein EPN86_00270 [Nanoarchaeota archaeon]